MTIRALVRASTLTVLSLSLPVSAFAACLSVETLLKRSIECSDRGLRAGMTRKGSCRDVVCYEHKAGMCKEQKPESRRGRLPEESQRSQGDARNAQRRSDVNTILNAVYQYAIDHKGEYPEGIPSVDRQICATGASDCAGYVDLHVLEGPYLVKIPSDPLAPTRGDGTRYMIRIDTLNRITVTAPHTENSVEQISATR